MTPLTSFQLIPTTASITPRSRSLLGKRDVSQTSQLMKIVMLLTDQLSLRRLILMVVDQLSHNK